jgi:hypothetical protein
MQFRLRLNCVLCVRARLLRALSDAEKHVRAAGEKPSSAGYGFLSDVATLSVRLQEDCSMSAASNRAISNDALYNDALRAAVVGVAAGALAFLALGPTSPFGLQVWALLTGWASFLLLGGGLDGLRKSAIHSLFGAFLALGALVFATHQPEALGVDFAVWAALGVAVTVALVTLAARLPLLGSVPASLLGYVSVLVATLPDYRVERILSPSVGNPVFGAVASLIIGALFAYAAEEIVQRLRSRVSESIAKA